MSTITEGEHVVELPSVLDPRVERGAALLDEKMPGWADKIVADDLDLAESNYCVLGQVGLCVSQQDYFDTATRILGVNCQRGGTPEERAHGFWAASNEYGGWDKYDAGALEQDWRLAILSRQQS